MLSESTARLVQHAAVLGEPETVRIKGADDPVPARRLLGMETPHVAVGSGESRMVGRRWEMAAIEGILERSIDGNGAVVALVGPAGIGKSRMVREIAATAAGRGVDVFWAFCESHASDIPFHAVTQLLRAVAGLPSLDDEAARARLRARFDDADEQDLALFDDLVGIRDPDYGFAEHRPRCAASPVICVGQGCGDRPRHTRDLHRRGRALDRRRQRLDARRLHDGDSAATLDWRCSPTVPSFAGHSPKFLAGRRSRWPR